MSNYIIICKICNLPIPYILFNDEKFKKGICLKCEDVIKESNTVEGIL